MSIALFNALIEEAKRFFGIYVYYILFVLSI